MNFIQKKYIFFLVLCAAGLRTVYFFQFQDNPFFGHIPRHWDQTIYYEGGRAFARGDLMAVAPILDNHFSPIYQYFLGIVFWLFDDRLETAWMVQFFLGTMSTVLVYSIACRFFENRTSLVAALLFTWYSPLWMYEGTFYRASLIVFLELATCRLLIAAADRPTWLRLMASALILALFMQTRSNNILLFPVALGYLWLRVFRDGTNSFRQLAGYVAVVLLVCAPALFWVKEVRGQWGLYDKDGPENLLLSNTIDHSVRRYEHNETYRSILETVPLETIPILKHIAGTAWDHPLPFLNLYLKKIYHYFNDYEIPATVNFYLFKEFAPVLGWGIPFAALAAMGITGAFLLGRRKGWTLLHSFAVTGFLIFLPFLILSRYRLYTVPFLCMFSAFLLSSIFASLQCKNWKAAGSLTLCVLGLGFLFKTDPFPEGKIRIDDLANMGSAYLNNQRMDDDALGYDFYVRARDLSFSLDPPLRQARKIRRLFHDYYLIQAQNRFQEGDLSKGINFLEQAVELDYTVPETHHMYASTLLKQGQTEAAFWEALQALTLKPRSAEIHLLLGAIYNNLTYSPYWIVYHWEQAQERLDDYRRAELTQTLTTIRRGLGISKSRVDSGAPDEAPSIRNLLRGQLVPLLEFPPNLRLPPEANNWFAGDTRHYMIRLYQHLILGSESESASIHYQLGLLYLKRENLHSAAQYHLEKAWDLGWQTPALAGLLNKLTQIRASSRLPGEGGRAASLVTANLQ